MKISVHSFKYFLFFLTICSVQAKSKLITLTEENWDLMLNGEWMVEFYAPWCPACKALGPVWKDFASWSDDLGISVAQVDVTTSPELSGRFMVSVLPTIYHIKDGVFRQYKGSREKDEFLSFIEEKKWQSLEPLASWKSPSSFQMGLVAKLFKLSMGLKQIHTFLTEDYGLPTWATYALFGVCTIAFGALLGLIIVCVIDFLFPPKQHDSLRNVQGRKSDEEDLKDDKDEQEKDAELLEESEKDSEVSDDAKSTESPSVRKRRARKAD